MVVSFKFLLGAIVDDTIVSSEAIHPFLNISVVFVPIKRAAIVGRYIFGRLPVNRAFNSFESAQ